VTAPIYPVSAVQVGIGKETTFGTGVSPSYSIPVIGPNPDDTHGVIPDTGWRTSPGDSFGHAQGPLGSTVALGGNVHADTIGFPLAGLLGDVVASGSGPVTTTMALLNSGTLQPPSYTISTFDPVQSLRWPGSVFTTCTLTASASNALTWSAQTVGLNAVTTTTPSTNYTSVGLMPAWVGSPKIGGSPVTGVLSSSVTITRVVTPLRNVDGSQQPYMYLRGVVSVTGTWVLLLESDALRAAYTAGSQTSMEATYAQGAGASAQQVKWRCSDVILTNVDRGYQGNKYMLMTVDWKADANSTDVGASGGLSPIQIVLKNQVTSGTYA